jgi:hypothetical protein
MKSPAPIATGRASNEKRKGNGTPPKPTVSVIGVRRLGSALALALQACGYSIEAVVARSHARRVAKFSIHLPRSLSPPRNSMNSRTAS